MRGLHRLVGSLVAAALVAAGHGALADEHGEGDLAAARALFADALRDEQAGHFGPALEKFKRVAQVKDTAAIEYRLGSCYEGLRRPAEAYGAFARAERMGEGEAAMADVVAAARERLAALSHQVARLSLRLAPGSPDGTIVRVDDVAVGAGGLEAPLALEPGAHVVVATAADRRAFRTEVTLPEGSEASLVVPLLEVSAVAPPATTPPTPVVPAEAQPRATSGWPAWAAVGAGGALVASAAVVWWLRHEDIASLDRSCPGGVCPAGSNEGAITSVRNRAVAEGPVAAGLGVAGLVAAGVGAYLVVTARHDGRPSTGEASVSFYASPRGAGATWTAAFR